MYKLFVQILITMSSELCKIFGSETFDFKIFFKDSFHTDNCKTLLCFDYNNGYFIRCAYK